MNTKAVSMKRPPSKIDIKFNNESFILRPYQMTDAPAVARAVRESKKELNRFMGWSHAEASGNLEHQYERIIGTISNYWSGGDYVMGLFLPDNKTFVGSFGLHRRTLNTAALEIGYWIHTKFAGRGITTQVTKVLVTFCFDYFDCDRVQCGYRVGNLGSQRVVEKVGFRIEGQIENFESVGSPEMTTNGYDTSRINVLAAVTKSMLPELRWLNEVRQSFVVRDWLGS